MTNSEQAIREIAEKWGWFVKATSFDMTQFELNKDTEQCLSDLTALISEGYVSKEDVNQEVDKRIAERMPSEMTLEEAEIAAKETDYACFAVEPEGNEINFADAAAFYLEGWNACRSRLTNPGVNDSQKTEGGKR